MPDFTLQVCKSYQILCQRSLSIFVFSVKEKNIINHIILINMIFTISPLLERTTNFLLQSLNCSNEGLRSFQDWVSSNQKLKDFETCLDISSQYDMERIQFCLESVLANSMKLSLLNVNEYSDNKSLTEIFDSAKDQESKIIFEYDFYSWITYIDNESLNKSLFQLAEEFKKEIYVTFNEVYEYFFSISSRKKTGQIYTVSDLSEFIVNTSKISTFTKEKYFLLDPSCGAGVFIVALLDAYTYRKNTEIIGIDISYFSCLMSRIAFFKKMKKFGYQKLDFIPIFWADFLLDFGKRKDLDLESFNKNLVGPYSSLNDNARKYILEVEKNGLDLIVGNPPYLRIQNIDKKRREIYTKRFESSTGRFDLYVLFIEHSVNSLCDNGKVAFICSNKFMTTSSGKGIRKFLGIRSTIEKIYDFTDTEMFMAMVLPCIIICSNNKTNAMTRYTNLTRTTLSCENVVKRDEFWNLLLNEEEYFKMDIHLVNHTKQDIHIESFLCEQVSGEQTWHFSPKHIEKLCNKIKLQSNFELKKIADISVGIKTTCDNVFIFNHKFLPFAEKESMELIRPLLVPNEIKRWKVTENPENFILYPYEINGEKIYPINLDKYPEVTDYLELNREALESRTYLIEAGRQWYEIWVPQKPAVFLNPTKIVTPDISTGNRFAMDFNKYYCQGTCYIINIREEDADYHYYILGLLNSKLIEFYHKSKLSTTIYAKRYRYWTSHMSKYPIIDARKHQKHNYEKIIELVKVIMFNDTNINIELLEEEINDAVFQARPHPLPQIPNPLYPTALTH